VEDEVGRGREGGTSADLVYFWMAPYTVHFLSWICGLPSGEPGMSFFSFCSCVRSEGEGEEEEEAGRDGESEVATRREQRGVRRSSALREARDEGEEDGTDQLLEHAAVVHALLLSAVVELLGTCTRPHQLLCPE